MEPASTQAESTLSHESLVATVAWLKEQLLAKSAEVDQLRAEFDSFKAALFERKNQQPDNQPWAAWRRAHWDELLRHRGEFVAIHPERGIVASGIDLSAVVKQVQSLGLSEEARVELVPRR